MGRITTVPHGGKLVPTDNHDSVDCLFLSMAMTYPVSNKPNIAAHDLKWKWSTHFAIKCSQATLTFSSETHKKT